MYKLIIGLLALSLVRVDVIPVPAYEVGGAFRQVQYDPHRDLFLDTTLQGETWCRSGPHDHKCWEPVEVPAKKKVIFSLRLNWFREDRYVELAAAGPLLLVPERRSRRFVGINVDAFEWPEESKTWPHLGLLNVGTIADEEGYEVKLWDEFIQGPAPLETLVQPGDIVGLSLVTTGIERGVGIARRCKELGARYVIAGNDSAAFRARQILRLPSKPIDAVFVSSSLSSIRSFFKQVGLVGLDHMQIPHVAIDARVARNATNVASEVEEEPLLLPKDYFLVPKLGLFGPEYWSQVWSTYRAQWGRKHRHPDRLRNAVALLAQGCGRAGAGRKCLYCGILDVGDVVVPSLSYLERTLEAYGKFDINTFFNATDSAYELGKLVRQLKKLGQVDSLVIYGRAQAIQQRPELLDEWRGVVRDRLLINCGMDSADERVLREGIDKSSSRTGSRVEENRQAVRIIKAAGVHLHYSLIFGSPGETRDSCERNLEFVQWTIDTLGDQLDVCESDIFWVNFGAPCSIIFDSYEEAVKLAAFAGKTISLEQWHRHFAQYADELVVPASCEKAWYDFFTNIEYGLALEYNARVRTMMEKVPSSITGRDFAFKPPA